MSIIIIRHNLLSKVLFYLGLAKPGVHLEMAVTTVHNAGTHPSAIMGAVN